MWLGRTLRPEERVTGSSVSAMKWNVISGARSIVDCAMAKDENR